MSKTKVLLPVDAIDLYRHLAYTRINAVISLNQNAYGASMNTKTKFKQKTNNKNIKKTIEINGISTG